MFTQLPQTFIVINSCNKNLLNKSFLMVSLSSRNDVFVQTNNSYKREKKNNRYNVTLSTLNASTSRIRQPRRATA